MTQLNDLSLNPGPISRQHLLSLPLPKDSLRRSAIPAGVRMARSMIDPTRDLDGIHPDEVLGVVEPFGVELLLADGTYSSGEDRVIGDGKILEARGLDGLGVGVLGG